MFQLVPGRAPVCRLGVTRRSPFLPLLFPLVSAVLSAIAVINEAVDRGDTADTLQSLLVDAAKLSGVHPGNAQLYQTLLAAEKSSKAQVPSAGPNHSDFSSVGTSRFGLELRAKGASVQLEKNSIHHRMMERVPVIRCSVQVASVSCTMVSVETREKWE